MNANLSRECVCECLPPKQWHTVCCVLQAKKASEADVTAESLRAMCENVLHLLSTTVDQVRHGGRAA